MIETERLILRNWLEHDRALFHEINSDDAVMEFFPFRRNREQSDALMDSIRGKIQNRNYGLFAAELKTSGETIGFIGIQDNEETPHYKPKTIDIGWRLAKRHWGKGLASEGARAALAFGFKTQAIDEITAMAVATNRRSIAVMERIGMRELHGFSFLHKRVPDSHRHLQLHVLYHITRTQWAAQDRVRPA